MSKRAEKQERLVDQESGGNVRLEIAKELIRTRRAVDDLQMSVEQVAVEAGLGLLYGEADPSRSGSSARDPSSPGQDKQTAGSRGCGGGRFTLDASRCLTRAPRLLTLAL
jgi:hypothetical protein